MAAVARRLRNHRLERLVRQARGWHGMEIIHETGAARGVLRALKQGKVVGIMIDQNVKPRRGGVFVDFFGLPVPTSRAPAAFARKLDVPVICAAVVRENGALRLRMATLSRPASQYADDTQLTGEMLALSERFISQYPDQYMWAYRRWQHVPESVCPEVRARFPFYAKDVAASGHPNSCTAG